MWNPTYQQIADARTMLMIGSNFRRCVLVSSNARNRIYTRVDDAADALSDLIETPQNFPLADYLEPANAKALAASLRTSGGEWDREDLERILVIREGFYRIRADVADRGDDGEHSIDQLLNALNRLYVDLEQAIRATEASDVEAAKGELARMRESPVARISDNRSLADEMREEATQVAVQSYETNRSIQVWITNNVVHNSLINLNVDIFRDMRIYINRLSATAFSLKLSLVEGPIFQGTFRFLHDSADKAIEGIKAMLQSLRSTYESAKEIAADVEALADKGNRFVKLIARFMKAVFGDESLSEPDVEMKLQSGGRGAPILSSAVVGAKNVLVGGKRGLLATIDTATGRVANPRIIGDRPNILSVALMNDGMAAYGTEEGLTIASALGAGTPRFAPYREEVVAVAVMPWGGLNQAIVTGSKQGDLRRWTLSGQISRWETNMKSREGANRLGRLITGLLPWEDLLVVCTENKLFTLRQDFEADRNEIDMGFEVRSIIRLDHQTIVVVGRGAIASVAFENGYLTRILPASPRSNYVAVRRLSDRVFIVGDDDGKISAIDVQSGEELGSVDTELTLRGLEVVGNRIVAYGGGWNSSNGNNVALVSWSRGQLLKDR